MPSLSADNRAALETALGERFQLDGSFPSLWALEHLVALGRANRELAAKLAWVPEYLAQLFARAFTEMGLTVEQPGPCHVRVSGAVSYELDTAVDFAKLLAPPRPFPTFYGTKWLGSVPLGDALVPWYGLATVFLNHEWARTDHDLIGNQRNRMNLAVPWLVEEHVRALLEPPQPRNVGQQLARDMVWPPLDYHMNDYGELNAKALARTVGAAGESTVRAILRGYAESQDRSVRLLAARELIRLDSSPQSRLEASTYRDAIASFHLEDSAALRLTIDALAEDESVDAERHERVLAVLAQMPSAELPAPTATLSRQMAQAPARTPNKAAATAEPSAPAATPQPRAAAPVAAGPPILELLRGYGAGKSTDAQVKRALMSHDGYLVPTSFLASDRTYGPTVTYGPALGTPPGELWVFTDRACAVRAAASGVPLGSYTSNVPALDWVERLIPLGVGAVRINGGGPQNETWNFDAQSYGLVLAWARGLAFEHAVRSGQLGRIRAAFDANETHIIPILHGRWMTREEDGVVCGCLIATIDVWNDLVHRLGAAVSMVTANADTVRKQVVDNPTIGGLCLIGARGRLPDALLSRTQPTLAGVWDAIRRGRKLDAIKSYREIHRVGLKEAKEAVERMESELQSGAASVLGSETPSVSRATAQGEADVERLIRAGKKIHAIKLYRELHGVGLRESKEAVENMEAHLRCGATAHPPGAPGPAPTAPGPREEIARFVLAGKKLQAIKVYRQHFGCGLRESKEAVERFESALGVDPSAALPSPT